MNVTQYYTALREETSKIFHESLDKEVAQNTAQSLIANLHDWYLILKEEDSSIMLRNAIEELDVSCLQMMLGLYRGSFSSLRLSLEMLIGSVYFSAFNLEYIEWKKGTQDLIWSKISCKDNGVLSRRFANAYFPELTDNLAGFLEKTKKLYRQLSEMVHGNNSTWDYNNPSISFSGNMNDKYVEYIKVFNEISNFILCVRYLNNLTDNDISTLETHLFDSIGHLEEIRIKIGGSI